MCNSLTVTVAHYEIFFAQINCFFAIYFQLFCRLQTANSGDSILWRKRQLRKSTQFNSSAPKLISWPGGDSKLN
jgi:hypothetical protein